MILMGTWMIGSTKKEAPEIAGQLAFFPFPGVEGGKGDPTNLIGSPGQNYFSIASTCEDKPKALGFLRDYVMDPSWIQFLASEVGYVPPVKDSMKYISDPLLQKVAQSFERAGHVQLYYDQFLSPALGEKHKDLVQALFGLEMTPQQVAGEHEKAVLAER
jgi:raffinose/stachyose/melibiose transport system substrate-binding protein